MVDHLFWLAVGAIGWGLSLVLYRWLARRNGWPLGAAQTALPTLTRIVGVLAIVAGVAFAATMGALHGGAVILIFGVGLAAFWTGFLRVGAQSALLLAPLCAAALLIAWPLRAIGL